MSLDLKTATNKLSSIINNSKNTVFFGGAGVSTESGIPDFRSTDGLYNQEWNYPPEIILSHSFWKNKPDEFYKFYRAKMIATWAKPNAAHLKLAELENKNKVQAIITQNIDNLHYLAGSKTVYELHGSVYRNYCVKCNSFYGIEAITRTSGVPLCQKIKLGKKCQGIVKPDVVLYEEPLDNAVMSASTQAIAQADCLIVAGTSLTVYPAASLVNFFRGQNLILINKSTTNADSLATLIINQPIAKVFAGVEV
jgi:NAD-dependent deacetylase